jgi:hypothetical protein
MISRDKNGLSLRYGDSVTVQTTPDAIPVRGIVVNRWPHSNEHFAGCSLIEFDNSTRQWMDAKHLELFGGF